MRTMDEPTTLDVFRTSIRQLEGLDHVHHMDGSCYKNRSGELCTNPIPDESTPHRVE